MHADCLREGIDNLTGTLILRLAQNLQQALFAKLFLLKILSLIEPVGINKERLSLDAVNLLTHIDQIRPQAYWSVGFHAQEGAMRLVTAYHGRIVSCIAEREVSRLQVHQSDEKGK